MTCVVATVLVAAGGEHVVDVPTTAAQAPRPAQAAQALARLEEALAEGDTPGAATLAAPGDDSASALLNTVVDNVRSLHIDRLSLRYVDEVGGVAADGTWSAQADLTWRYAGYDEHPARTQVTVTLRNTDDGGVGIVGFGLPGGRAPLWLAGPVSADRSPDTLVVVAGEDPAAAAGYERLARRAVLVVRRVLPRADAPLVVEVPDSAPALDRLLGADAGTYEGVAAVTTSGDGIVAASAPVHVFINPDEMGRLRRAGAQVVMSHEATHALTDAPLSRAPVWLVEGFADYVALRDVDLPLTTTAAQIRQEVRRRGVPQALPDQAEFDVSAPYLGASYEAAWLACRTLADRSGEAVLVELYRRAGEGEDVDTVLRELTGQGVAALTSAWQAELRALAR